MVPSHIIPLEDFGACVACNIHKHEFFLSLVADSLAFLLLACLLKIQAFDSFTNIDS